MSALNVNLKPCLCQVHHPRKNDGGFILYTRECTGGPVLVPCPLQRSVTFTVTLGECNGDGCATLNDTRGYRRETVHGLRCPARPIVVTCSISGKTWEESEVDDAWPEKNDGYLCSTGEEFPTLLRACRDRWALVKALVLGRDEEWENDPKSIGWNLRYQRDTVFAALADVVRHEQGLFQRGNDALRAANGHSIMRPSPECRESALTLAAYVANLIDQVGALP